MEQKQMSRPGLASRLASSDTSGYIVQIYSRGIWQLLLSDGEGEAE